MLPVAAGNVDDADAVDDEFERMPHGGYSQVGFVEEKPNPMRVARAALDRILLPGRGSRQAYATVGQDSSDEELEGIDGPADGESDAGDEGGEYWTMQRAGDCATFFNLCNTSLGIGILSFSLVRRAGRSRLARRQLEADRGSCLCWSASYAGALTAPVQQLTTACGCLLMCLQRRHLRWAA